MIEILVKKSGTVPRASLQDARGTLTVIENSALPFAIQRVYVISNVPRGAVRGEHAHHKTDQAIFLIEGSLTLHLDDGASRQSIKLSSLDEGVRLAPLLWHSLSDFSEGCVALFVASLPYDESDYIRDYDEFKNYARTV